MNTGVVYQILNTATNKVYIGSTKDFEDRKRRHLYDLRRGKHHSVKLQKSFKKHGEQAFEFSELCYCLKCPPFEAEQEVLDQRKPYQNGYNIGIRAESSAAGRPCSPEKKAKISIARRGKYTGSDNWFYGKKHSIETKLRLRQFAMIRMKGATNPMFGRKHSETTKALISSKVKGLPGAFKGHEHTEEAKSKMSVAKKGKYTGLNHHLFGKKRTEKDRLAMSNGWKRRKAILSKHIVALKAEAA